MNTDTNLECFPILKNIYYRITDSVSDITLQDIILFSVLPAIIIITEYFSVICNGFRTTLEFQYHDPQWWQYITSAYVHSGWTHFSSNLVGYFLFGITCFILAANIKRQRDFFNLLFFTAIFYPIFDSIIKSTIYPLYLPTLYNYYDSACGASGVISAVLGFIPIFWLVNISHKSGKNQIKDIFFWICLVYVAFWLEATYLQFMPSMIIFYITALSFILLIGLYRSNLLEIGHYISQQLFENPGYFLLIIFSPVPFLIYPLSLLPTDPIASNIDFLSHYFGILSGISISYLYFKFWIKIS